ncbi:MAG: MDR family MFS transporter [Ktedonobacteraceae bacterium]
MYHRLVDPKVNVAIVFVAAMFMSIMDSTIVTVALPALSRQFHVPTTSIDAVIVGYLVSLAVVIPASGWLGDHWGTKRVFLIALVLFTLTSALCGLAQTLPMLIGFRILQGIAGGALTPVGTTMLYRTFPPEERVRVSRILNIPTVIAPASGPVIGGLLIQQLSWRWVFYVNVPIGIAACLFGWLFLREDHLKHPVGRFDPTGFLLAGLGLALLMYAMSEGPTYGWTSPGILGSAFVGLLLLSAFVVFELRTKEPMLDLRLLKDRLFRITNLVTLFSSAGFLGLLFVAPLFLQEARGVSALVSGLTTFPEALGIVVSTQIVARLYPSVGPRRLIAAGLTGVTMIICLFCFMDLTTNLWLMRGLMFLTGVGMAYTFIPTPAAAFATISPAATGKASALYSAQRQIGSAFGVALVSTVLSIFGLVSIHADGTTQPNLTAYHAAFLTSAVLVLIAAGIALFIHDIDAAATMQRKQSSASIPEQPVVIEM